VPDVVARQPPRRLVPVGVRATLGVDRTPDESAESRIPREAKRDPLEEVVGIDAVVVRECDNVGVEQAERFVPGT